MFLERINSPHDLKKLTPEQLPFLVAEIRQRMLEVVSETGGHLASSLGTVELTIVLHYCLDTPWDKIIWDVGHQAYTHKIITGRNKDFTTLRQYQGLSGFPSKDESEYDLFTTGHSSTAVSLALGVVCARDLLPAKEHFKVVAVIGDGSLSGGLCFEGLNNAGHLKKDLLVVLNTNELSIAPNVGAISTYLNKLISLPIYNRFKSSLEGLLSSRVPKGSRILKAASKFEESLKGLFVPGILFEELGFRYFGPFDGHNIHQLIQDFKKIIHIKGPLLVHVITKKGKGYLPAEIDPVRFHSAGPFEIATGRNAARLSGEAQSYTEVFSRKLVQLGQEDQRIVAITAAMPEGTGLDRFRDAYPQRFFDVGIAEGHALCFAAGLAQQGLKPVVAIYSTFLQRAFDQIIEEIALQELGVVLALDRAGIVGGDGATHQGIFDIAFLRGIPNLALAAPKDRIEFERLLEFAVSAKKPIALRYPKDTVPFQNLACPPIQLGKAEVLREGQDAVIVALGSMVFPSLQAADLLGQAGLSIGVVNARFVKPLDKELLQDIAGSTKLIITAEEGILEGGFGSAVRELLERPVLRLGLPSEFIPCGKRDTLLSNYGLDSQGVAQKIQVVLKQGGRNVSNTQINKGYA